MTPSAFDRSQSEVATQHVKSLEGPILVLGASGFVGANLLHTLLRSRKDVYGTASRLPAWRLQQVPRENIFVLDLLIESSLDAVLNEVKPKTVFDCTAFGAYSFEQDARLIYETNFIRLTRLVPRLKKLQVTRYVHAGSSSEYGLNCAGPKEDAQLLPNSAYAVSKAAASTYLAYEGRVCGFPCTNLRLYSVYGPLEDSSRLIPAVVSCAAEGKLPNFADPETSRDFIYIDDAVSAFIHAAAQLRPDCYGTSFNIGSGRQCTIRDMAETAVKVFGLSCEPQFGHAGRKWDVRNWFSDPESAGRHLGWRAGITLEDGLRKTAEWYRSVNASQYMKSSKKFLLDERNSVTAVIACYRDNLAIPVMYARLKAVFTKLGIDHEIIFVNDCSPDDSEEVIRRLTAEDPRVMGISHSRNFGSQAAFMSGMRIATKNACVLLDGDLQDPPEMIEAFVEKWRQGFDVVYGTRVKREAPLLMQICYKAFYVVFNYFSYIPVPRDAGDFSLMDRRVVNAISTEFPERDLFLRGVRAFAGFRQCGIDYVRPERMFGVTTNNLTRNLGWAKKGILSFSNTPLQVVSLSGGLLFVATTALAIIQITLRIVRPDTVPAGITTLLLAVMFFGSGAILATAIVGGYIAKIFEEVKSRPLYIRRAMIQRGEVRCVQGQKTTAADGN